LLIAQQAFKQETHQFDELSSFWAFM
jgi:hypothetical protein